MPNENKKPNNKPKLTIRRMLSSNGMMLKKIVTMSPWLLISMVFIGILSGIQDALTTIYTFALFNALDMPDMTFLRIVGYLVVILAVDFFFRGVDILYSQCIKPILERGLQHRMHEELFHHALSMDLACYDDPSFYTDYVWAMDESKNRAMGVLNDVASILTYLISISTLIGLMLQVDIVVGLILFVGCVLSTIVWHLGDKISFKRDEETKPQYRLRGYINRAFHLADFAKEMRMGRAGDNLQTMYHDSVEETIRINMHYFRREYGLEMIHSLISNLTSGLTLLLLLFQLYAGQVQLGAFVASVGVIWNLSWSMYDFARKLIKLPENAMYIEKYRAFLSYKPNIVGGTRQAEPFASIELKNVSFSYEKVQAERRTEEEPTADEPTKSHESLKNVNLTIRRGDKIAIVGYNGAGKTTLTKLLMRLYDPTAGEILYNGHPLRDYDLASLRSRIGAVFQDYKIFAATIAENVLGRICTDADRPIVEDALEKATFSDKLATLEQGIDTVLTKEFSEEGVNLSGGEAQKVAIARIFAHPYDLLLMDEPSSALDPAAEYALNHTILDFAQDKTIVFISHRLSTTRMADQILMFADGALIEAGSHDALMAQHGKYAEMFQLQAKKYRMEIFEK